jgi:hypothetical protein
MPITMDALPETNPEQNALQSAANERTTEGIRSWGTNKLILSIQNEQPELLSDEIILKLRAERISGRTFLKHAGDVEFFHEKCKLPLGTSEDFADLAKELEQSKYYLSYHGRNSDSQLTMSQGDSKHASLEKPSDTASKKRDLDSEKEASQSPNQKRLRVSLLPGSRTVYETESAEVRCVLSFHSWLMSK